MVALNYNPEIVRTIRRGLRNKTINMEENPIVTMPVNSVANPLKVRDSLMDMDSTPDNYLTSNVAKDDAVANTTYTTLNTITVPQGYYYFIWGITANIASTAGKMGIAAIATTEVSGLNDTSVLWAAADCPVTGSAWVTLQAQFTRPIPLPTGTAYVRIYHEKGGAAQAQVALRLEIRKIENRDPEGGR